MTQKSITWRDRLYLALYHFFRWLVTHTPEKLLYPVLKGIARVGWFFDKKHRHIARVNLDLAFGDEMNEKEKERIIKKTYENLVCNLADFITNQNITKEELLKKVTFENSHFLENELKKGKPVIAMTAHYGNWEMLSLAIAAKYTPLTIVGRPLDSKAMNDLLSKSRQRFDIELLPKKGAMRGMIDAVRKNRSVGLLVDQNTGERDGVPIVFFGKKARQTPAAAILARRFGISIVPVFIHSTDHRHHTITFYPPLHVEKTENKENDILQNVQAQADAIERAIRNKPDEWFWLHRRWKSCHPTLYKKER